MKRSIFDFEREFNELRKNINLIMSKLFNVNFEGEFDSPLLSYGNVKNGSLIANYDSGFRKPLINFIDNHKEIVAEIELPGVKKEDIKLEVKDGILTLYAEQRLEKKLGNGENKGYESRRYVFSQSVSLPCEVDEENVKAKYENGILRVYLPKRFAYEKDGVKYVKIE